MADYDWSRGCCSATVGFPHTDFCKENPAYEANVEHARMRVQGYLWSDNARAYRCRRGCGALVWDTDVHSANVCPNWTPTVG